MNKEIKNLEKYCKQYSIEYLLDEWDYEKNNNLKPSDFSPFSNKKVWWKCEKGHEFPAIIGNRTKRKNKCPYCSNKKVLAGYNDLYTTHPDIAKFWHPTKNKEISVYDISHGSDVIVWWQCEKGHEHKKSVYNQVIAKSKCPTCSNQVLLKGFNDLKTVHPALAEEWHPTKNGTLSPDQVITGSNTKVWWQCKNGHEWRTSIHNRTNRNLNCRSCSDMKKTSFPEQAIYYYIKKIFNDAHLRYRGIDSVEIDIFIPSLNIAIEYDGYFWHKDRYQSDLNKVEFLSSLGIDTIRIREEGLNIINTTNCYNYIRKNLKNNQSLELSILWILKKIKLIRLLDDYTLNNLDNLHIDVKGDAGEIYTVVNLNIQEKSVENNKKLLTIWNYEKNGGIHPSQISYGSDKLLWWKCEKGHEWQARPSNLVNSKVGCPYCLNKKVLEGYNDLSTTNPDIAEEWHPTKNGDLKPNQIVSGNNKIVWWKCKKGHEWENSPNLRISKKAGCPYCSKRLAISGETDLETMYPNIAKEWHPTKNGDLKPNQIASYSNKEVWWICSSCEFEYKRIVGNRTRRVNYCPNCRKISK